MGVASKGPTGPGRDQGGESARWRNRPSRPRNHKSEVRPEAHESGWPVVDEQGKPVPDARALTCSAPSPGRQCRCRGARNESDAGGQFHLANPTADTGSPRSGSRLGFSAGLGNHLRCERQTPLKLLLQKTQPRTVKVETADGRPVAGAVVSPVATRRKESRSAELPETLAMPTFRDYGAGRPGVDQLPGGDSKLVVSACDGRVDRHPGFAIARASADVQAATITVRLKPTSHLAGHVRTPRANRLAAKRSRSGTRETPYG